MQISTKEYERKKNSKTGVRIESIVAVAIYFIIYSGYLKILFPQIGFVFTIIQAVAMFAGVVLLLVNGGKLRFYRENMRPIFWLVVAFIIIAIGIINTNNMANATGKIESMIVTTIFMLLLFFSVKYIDSEQWVAKVINIIVNLNIFFLLVYVLINITSIMTLIYTGLRGGSLDSNPIWIARMCSDTMIYIIIKNYGNLRMKNILQLIFLFVIAFFMGSKGPLVAFFVALYIFYQLIGNKKFSKRILVSFVGILLVGVLALVIVNSQSSFIQSRFSLESILTSSPGYRLSRYMFSLSKIPEHFFVGHGLGSWTVDYWEEMNYVPIWVTSQMQLIDYPHNLVLEVLYDNGIIALLPMIMALISFFKLNRKVAEKKYYVVFFVLCITNFLYAMFSGSVTEGNRNFYYLLALYLGLLNSSKVYARYDIENH